MSGGFELDEFHAVVRAYGRRRSCVECVQDADCVGLVGEIGDLVTGRPAHCVGLIASGGGTVDCFATEDERDDQAGHVLVDAGHDRRERDLHPRLFEDFSLKGFRYGLARFKDTARRLPLAVVAPLNQQRTAVVVDDDPGDAHGVGALSSTQRSSVPSAD